MNDNSKRRTVIEQCVLSVWFVALCIFDGPGNYYFLIMFSSVLLLIKKNMLYLIIPDLCYFLTVFVMTLLGDWKDYYWNYGVHGYEYNPSVFNGVREILKAFLLILVVQFVIMCFCGFIRMIINSGKETFETIPDMTPDKTDVQNSTVTAVNEHKAVHIPANATATRITEIPEPVRSETDMSDYPMPQRTPANIFATLILLPVCLIVFYIMVYYASTVSGGFNGLNTVIESGCILLIVEPIIIATVMIQINPRKAVSKKYFKTWTVIGTLIFLSILGAFLLFIPEAVFIPILSAPPFLSLCFFLIRAYWTWQKMKGESTPYDEQDKDSQDDDENVLIL